MSISSSNPSASLPGSAYKWRERLLIAAAVALVGCRLLSVRHSVAAMVVATLILTGVFTCFVRGSARGRRWAFYAALPIAVSANVVALAVGGLLLFLAESGLLVQNRLGMYVEWNRAFVCLPIAALVNLLAWGWPAANRRLRLAAWLANSLLLLYAGGYWSVHESYERFGGAPPFGADLVAALAAVSLMALAWDPAWSTARPVRGDTSAAPVARSRRRMALVLLAATAIGAALVSPFQTVIRRCRLEAALTSLGCEVTDRTRRSAPLRIRELAPLRPYVTEIEAVFIPKDRLTAANCQQFAELLGQVTMLDEIEAASVPKGCETLLSRLGPGSFVQYLSLSGAGVHDDVLAIAGGFPRLRTAAFTDATITDAGVAKLAGSPWLETLVLRNTPLDGSGLAALTSLPSLTQLDLSGTHVGDDQVAVLQRFARLTDLDLSNTRVTAAGVRKLQQALPQCEIKWSP
ncbi:MAG TPA: hypothetical protein VNH11_20205 [Pirellulales bacterium]|nr:hypothetical protein [Pirellulales bacterium]